MTLHVRIRPAESPPAEGAIWEAEGPDQHLEYDWFQRAAFACVERGESVLVAAPTSAGKTAVARKAIHQCIASGTRCVYTAPIKALSNEKFSEFVQEFSPDRVALLTGDARAGNPETAHVVVMTTEVLVSLLHSARLEDPDPGPEGGEARPPGLIRSLSCAVFDEIHYIADEERGTAWEEAIVLLERHVQLVGLSATVPNFCELAGWVAQTRHLPCHGIYSRRRPVPLVHGVVCCPFDGSSPVEVTKRGRFMQRAYEAAVQRLPEVRTPVEVSRADRGRDLVALVQACRNGQLPLIVFSFSRRESAEMARQLAPAVRLKPGARRLIDDTVREVIQKHLQEPDRQLQSVRECHFLLSRGVGVHHGGLLPVLREITEKLFKDGLVRVLCTTETFAVGVNMPSRSVVFNWPADHEFQKYDGMEQRNILVAEYMQMAGRAGRRNQDKRGNAWNVITRRHPSQRLRALMIGGNIERVESKFRLSWPLMLRCLRSGGSGVLQLLLTQSFRQFLSKMANASVFESELEPKMQVLRAEGLAEGAGLKELGSAAACLRLRVLLICGVMDEVSLGQLRRRAGFVQATYLWMQKENFERCSDAAGGAEYDGILARVLKRTSPSAAQSAERLLLKQLEMAMALLGLAEQEALLQQARGMLSRGGAAYQSLPFLDSIYLAIAFEPDTLDASLLRRQQRPCPYPVGAKVELAPSEVGFSHFSISARFKPERGAPAMSIAETLQELLDGKDPAPRMG
ncbi:unnamed protein product [Effrenium voratum]|nr:unnamed protein product [Effrenium voratum]